jgi:hypothetical protein
LQVLAIPPASGTDPSASTTLISVSIDPAEQGGAWWVETDRQLFRSTDMGKTWEPNADLGARNRIVHAGDLTYRLAGTTLFQSSDRGATWHQQSELPPSDEKKRPISPTC